MLFITPAVSIPDSEIELTAIRSQGAGGQNVNKVSSAIHLRFNIYASSLPDTYKERLLNLKDQRITKQGEIIIKAQQFRTQDQNREDALKRLQTLIQSITKVRATRKATKPTRASKQKRMDKKSHRGKIKSLRGAIKGD